MVNRERNVLSDASKRETESPGLSVIVKYAHHMWLFMTHLQPHHFHFLGVRRLRKYNIWYPTNKRHDDLIRSCLAKILAQRT